MNTQNLTTKKEWVFSFLVVICLTIGSSIIFHLNKLLIKIFTKSVNDLAINAKEGAILVALEMGIIPISAVIAFALMNKWSFKQTVSISWKVFIIGTILGLLFGSTYTLGSQRLICGIIH